MPQYLPHILYGLGITSTSIHLLWHRRESEEQRRHYTTRLALLEETARRLRAGEEVPNADFDMIKKLAAEQPGAASAAARGVEPDSEIGWREVIFGRKGVVRDVKLDDQRDAADLEKVQKEIQASS
ncbi:hypothetical protein BDW22DRAFT_1355903 [Trametopsis cervina]|nr:hypothetical protein BDW22DRAFT_1355903 [Trametopsis cervina]